MCHAGLIWGTPIGQCRRALILTEASIASQGDVEFHKPADAFQRPSLWRVARVGTERSCEGFA